MGMLVTLFRSPDGTARLVCTRPNGTRTDAELGPADGWGPLHDLAHYVVETSLGLRNGFYGLVAQGWRVADFLPDGAGRPLPDEAVIARAVAGTLARDALGSRPMSAEEFNFAAAAAVAALRPGQRIPQIPEPLLEQLRAALAGLHRRWLAVADHEVLELEIEA